MRYGADSRPVARSAYADRATGQESGMRPRNARDEQMAALRERLSRLSEASLRINESLELDAVLQGVLDSARSLTDARYALITTMRDTGEVEDFVVSGLTAEEAQRLWEVPERMQLFSYFSSIPAPLRMPDFAAHMREMGLPDFRLPVPISSFIAAPIRHRGVSVGNIHVAKDLPGLEFTREDEETLVMFASQVALVVANARRHRDERRARADLETLIDTSPVGVAVFDMGTGAPVSFNREARRIVDGLRDPDQTTEQLLQLLTVRRADGRKISLEEFPLAQVLGTSETVRAEEIVMETAGGRSVTVLLNATPIRSDEGEVESVVVTMQDMTPLEEIERLRAEFLGMVSHELRTPLTLHQGLGNHHAGRHVGPGPRRDTPVPAYHRQPGRPHERPDRQPAGRGAHRNGHAAGQPRTGGGRSPGGPGPEHLPERRR